MGNSNSLKMPEVTIYKILKSIFKIVKDDYNTETDKTKTILYDIFGLGEDGARLKFESFDYFNQSIETFIKKQPEIYLGYNMEVSAMGCIHILLPSENGEDFQLGANENYQGYNLDNSDADLAENYKEIYTQMFNTSYNLMITSENTFEVLLIYNLLKASFIALNAHIELAGLRLPKVSGQDINFQSDLIPPHIFHRSLMLNFKYEVSVSDFFYKRIIKSFKVTGITYENDTL